LLMRRVWRIVKRGRAAGAFDGEGARRTGGRWNSPGTRVVYTAEHASLAALEMLAHLQRSSVLLSYALIPCDVPDEMVAPLDRASLPRAWRASPAPAALQRLGDEWAASMRSVALEVPSAIVEVENNVLLNPAHPDFAKIVIGDAMGFAYDVRLVEK
ncbi:MAG TPA: RES family NAD+ phosphorylase, partial [Thermoanaerobaculia bacterium]|nr:RES family NAD+ phosphorylase [Thermoanaerobaculia bacterium]